MAPGNDDDTRSNRDGSEDNPFIAFRRFADSQVSSLLNTVFTLPTVITLPTRADQERARRANEQCLFRKAGSSQCDALREVEDEIEQIRSAGRAAHRAGDLKRVVERVEELSKLDRQADEIRKEILKDDKTESINDGPAQGQKELVERVAKEKGHHWGWDWSWGYPTNLDEEERARWKESRRSCRRKWRQQESSGASAPSAPSAQTEAGDGWQEFNARWENIKKQINEELPRVGEWSFPPPADAQPAGYPPSEQMPNLFDELGAMIMDEVTKLMLPRSFQFHKDEYSPRALEDNEDLKKAGIPWRDAFEDLVRAERGAPLLPLEQLGQSEGIPHDRWTRRFWDPEYAHPESTSSRGLMVFGRDPRRSRSTFPKRVPWEGEETNEEPSYEYAHDHEDQHDDPPTPKMRQGPWTEDMPATELEAYERLLGPTSAMLTPTRTTNTDDADQCGPSETPQHKLHDYQLEQMLHEAQNKKQLSKDRQQQAPLERERSSLLSTMTTTERTVAPDGTTTTKFVLKKRFSDGREESSETVHTQRGQEADDQRDRWQEMMEPRFSSSKEQQTRHTEPTSNKAPEQKKGWFWSN